MERMARIWHIFLFISAVVGRSVSDVCFKDKEWPGRVPRPALHDIPTPREDLIPKDCTPPSYRVPLLTTHRLLTDIFSATGSDADGDVALTLQQLLLDLNYTVEVQTTPPDLPGSMCPSATRYSIFAWPNPPSSPRSLNNRDLLATHANTLPNAAPPALNKISHLDWHHPSLQRSLNNRVLLTSHLNTGGNWFPYALNTSYIPRNATLDFSTMHPSTYLLGRGAVHAKASAAAQITAVTDLVLSSAVPADSVMLLFVTDGHGGWAEGGMMRHFSALTARLVDGPPPAPWERLRAVIFGEPTGGRLACGAKGFARLLIGAHNMTEERGGGWKGEGEGDDGEWPMMQLLKRAVRRVESGVFGKEGGVGETRVRVGNLVGLPGWKGGFLGEIAQAHVEVEVGAGDEGSGAEMVGDEIRRAAVRGEDAEGRYLDVTSFGSQQYGPTVCECDVKGFDTTIAGSGTDIWRLKGSHVRYMYGPGNRHPEEGFEEGLTVKELEDGVEGYKKLIMHALESPFPPPTHLVDTCPVRYGSGKMQGRAMDAGPGNGWYWGNLPASDIWPTGIVL